MARKKEAVIWGFYGNHNLGDDAILTDMINLLEKQQDKYYQIIELLSFHWELLKIQQKSFYLSKW
ncbi:hypothetical protein [Nostoc sp. CCY 9925]|uniref:hypothetical protein n=1 Tax=Nostoc sp. CCY 9925 TaxID=3103865 RepID=UPI0039C6B164